MDPRDGNAVSVTSDAPGEVQAKAVTASQKEYQTPQRSTVTVRQVVRKATLGVRVAKVEEAERAISRITEGLGGYVETTTSSDLDTDHPSLDLSLRVPVGKFDEALSRMEALGVRTSKTIASEDVTGALVDYTARLKTMSAQEEVLRGLLKRAPNLDEMANMEGKVADLRAEIESISAQRKALGELASLSSIRVTLTQASVVQPVPRDPNWFAQIWADSTTQFSYVFQGVMTILVYLAVFSPLWVPAVLVGRRVYRNRSTSMPWSGPNV